MALLIAAVVLAIAAVAVPLLIYTGRAPDEPAAATAPARVTGGPVNAPSTAPAPSTTTPGTAPVASYRSWRSDARGYSVDVPTILTTSAEADDSDGVRLTEQGGATMLRVYGSLRFPDDDPATLLASALATATAGGGTTTYSDKDADSFTGSGLDGSGRIFHIHGQLSGDSVAVVSWTYPQAEKARWDAAVTRTTKTLAFG